MNAATQAGPSPMDLAAEAFRIRLAETPPRTLSGRPTMLRVVEVADYLHIEQSTGSRGQRFRVLWYTPSGWACAKCDDEADAIRCANEVEPIGRAAQRTCAFTGCGRLFAPARYNPEQRHCTIACMQKALVETGKKKGGRARLYFHTERTDDECRRLYDGTSASIDRIAARTGFPRHAVKSRARKLGLCRFKEPRWTPEEQAWLRDNIAGTAWKVLASHLHRTETAVKVMAKRLGASRLDAETYTANALAEILGVDGHRVLRWIEAGMLTAKRDRQEERVPYTIEPGAIRRFILQYPGEIDLRRIEGAGYKATFLDIIAGGDQPVRVMGTAKDYCGLRGEDEDGAF